MKNEPLRLPHELSDLPSDPRECHEVLVDCFGQFLLWLRNWSIQASRDLIESEEARYQLGTIRRGYYDGVAAMTHEQREAALMLAEETLNGFSERLVWLLGGRSVDMKFGSDHAYRFQIDMELVNIYTDEVVKSERISVGGKKFFGTYWPQWLSRYSAPKTKRRVNPKNEIDE